MLRDLAAVELLLSRVQLVYMRIYRSTELKLIIKLLMLHDSVWFYV